MVFIQKLEITNFKSFGGTTIVRFSKGLNVIVGPNGAGKSNILDAIVFALGILSAKFLRMRVLSDIIFNPEVGNSKLKPARSAIVKIYFDNSDRFFPVDSKTVIISRELHKDGRSIYRLNGHIITRNDLLDFLQSVGLSPDNYNIIPQGKISEIVNMNPMQIRGLIEEIAGISSYDEKKELAMKQLQRVENNLSAIKAVLVENERKLEQLKKEKEDAEKYRHLSQQLEFHQQVLIRKRLENLYDELRTLENELSENNRILEEISREIDLLREERNGFIKQIKEIKESLKQNRNVQYELQSILTKYKTELVSKESALNNLIREINNYSYEIKEGTKKISKLSNELVNLSYNLNSLLNERNHYEQKLREMREFEKKVQDEIKEFNSKHDTILKKLESIKYEIEHKQNKIYSLKGKLNSLIVKKETDLKLLSELGERINTLNSDLHNLLLKRESDEKELKNLILKRQNMIMELNKKNEQLVKLDEKLKNLENLYKSLTNKINQYNTEKAMIMQLRKRYLSKRKAVKEILRLRDEGKISGIVGTINEIISVPEKYMRAISAALGGKLNYIIVRDEDVAISCITYLKENKIGTATFIPLSIIKSQISQSVSPQIDGIEGNAIDLIEYDKKYENAVRFLLGNVLVVRDINIAKSLIGNNWRKVTIDGDIIEPNGLISGGSLRRDSHKLFTSISKREIEEISKQLDIIESELKTLSESRNSLQKEINTLTAAINETLLSIRPLETKINNYNNRINDIQKSINQLNDRIQDLSKKIKLTENEISALNQIIDENQIEYNNLKSEYEKLWKESNMADLDNLNIRLENLRQEISKVLSELNTINIKIAQTEERKRSLENKINEIEARNGHLRELIEKREKLLPNLHKEIEELKNKVKSAEVKIQALIDISEKLENDLNEYQKLKEDIDTKIQNLKDRTVSFAIKNGKINSKIEIINKQISELKEKLINNIEIPKGLFSLSIEDLENKIAYISSQIEALGEINHKAITQYEEQLKRYNELKEKETKIIEEKRSIIEFMEKLERERTKVFMDTLSKVNENMRKIFSILSPGGEAYLEPEFPEKPLDGGLFIKAKPAGKNVTHIGMMSGGEKSLTALALVFALQQYFSAPFYILDEIDAALDNQNIDRVARLLKEFSKFSQIIVITLREQTMAKADTLIGVTQRYGVTNVIFLPLGKEGVRMAKELRGVLRE